MNRRDFIKLSAAALAVPLVGLPELPEAKPESYWSVSEAGIELGRIMAQGLIDGIEAGKQIIDSERGKSNE